MSLPGRPAFEPVLRTRDPHPVWFRWGRGLAPLGVPEARRWCPEPRGGWPAIECGQLDVATQDAEAGARDPKEPVPSELPFVLGCLRWAWRNREGVPGPARGSCEGHRGWGAAHGRRWRSAEGRAPGRGLPCKPAGRRGPGPSGVCGRGLAGDRLERRPRPTLTHCAHAALILSSCSAPRPDAAGRRCELARP